MVGIEFPRVRYRDPGLCSGTPSGCIQETDGDGNKTEYLYNAAGQVTQTSVVNSSGTTLSSDADYYDRAGEQQYVLFFHLLRLRVRIAPKARRWH